MPTTYATKDEVSGFMTAGQFPFDVNSPYTTTMVEMYINAAEDEIDGLLKRTWRTKTSTDEEHPIDWNITTTYWVTNHYGSVQLRYGPIKTVTKIEILKNSTWEDITANEGQNKDWFADKARRKIFLRKVVWPVLQPIQVRVTYTYGEASADMPVFIKMATILRAAWYILQSDDYTVLLPEGTDTIRASEKSLEWNNKFHELITPHRRGMVWK